MEPYFLEHDEEVEAYTVRGPDGFEWWIDDDNVLDIDDLNVNAVLAELNMLYSMVGGTDAGTV